MFPQFIVGYVSDRFRHPILIPRPSRLLRPDSSVFGRFPAKFPVDDVAAVLYCLGHVHTLLRISPLSTQLPVAEARAIYITPPLRVSTVDTTKPLWRFPKKLGNLQPTTAGNHDRSDFFAASSAPRRRETDFRDSDSRLAYRSWSIPPVVPSCVFAATASSGSICATSAGLPS